MQAASGRPAPQPVFSDVYVTQIDMEGKGERKGELMFPVTGAEQAPSGNIKASLEYSSRAPLGVWVSTTLVWAPPASLLDGLRGGQQPSGRAWCR